MFVVTGNIQENAVGAFPLRKGMEFSEGAIYVMCVLLCLNDMCCNEKPI